MLRQAYVSGGTGPSCERPVYFLTPRRARDPLLPRLAANESVLIGVCKRLTVAVTANHRISPAGEWLLDNFHLYFPAENNTSHLDTGAEMERILGWRPDVVITFHAMPPGEENPRTAPLVHAYTGRCKLWFTADTHEAYASHLVDVYGDCGADPAGGTSKAGAATGR